MSSAQPDSSEDQPDDGSSVQYSGGRSGAAKRSGRVFFVIGVLSIVATLVLFLLVGFLNGRTTNAAKARNAGGTELPLTASTDDCMNPCRSPHFFCHPASEKDDKGCFEPGCACFPDHCPKRCPPHQECVLGSPVDYRGCFRPHCRCAFISSDLPASNCTSSCPQGQRCRFDAPTDAHGCPLPGCHCEPDCVSRCPVRKRCASGSPVDENGCLRPGCICEPDCVPRCPAGQECTATSPRDLHGCFLPGCLCESSRRSWSSSLDKAKCVSPCPLGKQCTDNSTRDERGCFIRGCTCEVKCPPRCPPGHRCTAASPKDIEGCFLFGCECEPKYRGGARPKHTDARKREAGAREHHWPLAEDRPLPVGLERGSLPSNFHDSHALSPYSKEAAAGGAISWHGHTGHNSSVNSSLTGPGKRSSTSAALPAHTDISSGRGLHKATVLPGHKKKSAESFEAHSNVTPPEQGGATTLALTHGPRKLQGLFAAMTGDARTAKASAEPIQDGRDTASTFLLDEQGDDDDNDDDGEEAAGSSDSTIRPTASASIRWSSTPKRQGGLRDAAPAVPEHFMATGVAQPVVSSYTARKNKTLGSRHSPTTTDARRSHE